MKNIFYLFLVLLLCMGCEDPEPMHAGVETTVSGRIYDYENQLPLGGQKIVIKEYMKSQNYGAIAPNYDFKGNIDSTYTDVNGNFNFTFKTTGRGNAYKVFYEETEDVSLYSDVVEIEKKDLGVPVDLYYLSGTQLYPLTLKITPNNLSGLPIKIKAFFPAKPFILDNITENNVAVTRNLYVDKNTQTSLQFVMLLPAYVEKRYSVKLPATGTTTPEMQTIELNEENFVD